MESSNNTHKDAWDWRTRIPNNVHIVHAGPNTGFFKRWCNVMRLMVPMTDRELDVISSFLKHRWELSKVISDPAVLDSQLMSNDIRDKTSRNKSSKAKSSTRNYLWRHCAN